MKKGIKSEQGQRPRRAALSNRRVTDVRAALLMWSEKNVRDYPWRTSGRSPFEIVLAEALLKRTTATAAARLYPRLLLQVPSLSVLGQTSETQLIDILSSVGLQRQRARTLKALSEYLTSLAGVPRDLEALQRAPGLGPYAARAVLSFGFGDPFAIVDSNVKRVLGRLFRDSLPSKPPDHVFQVIADKLLPKERHREFNFAVLDLGATVCRYSAPRCTECPLASMCDTAKAPVTVSVLSENPLRALRKSKDYSLVRLSKDTGLSKLTLINIEAGRTQPSAKTLHQIAETLGVYDTTSP